MGYLTGTVLLGVSLAFAAAVQPGPLFAFLVSRVAAHGWKSAVPACFAPIFSDGPIAAASILVIGRLPAVVLPGLRAAGGVLLLYLAAKTYRQSREPMVASPGSAPRTLGQAVVVNLLNPNAYLGWALVLGPVVVAAWNHHPAYGVALIASFYSTICLVMVALVYLMGTVRMFTSGSEQRLLTASACVLAGVGLILLGQAAQALWTS